METRATFYSRNREKCLTYQYAYNALHKTERKAYDHARYLKKKEARQKANPPVVREIIIEQNVRVDFT